MVAKKNNIDDETCFNAQNRFFFDKYSKLKALALYPYTGWHRYDEEQIKTKDTAAAFSLALEDINLKRKLSPLLVPATLVTCSVALILAVGVAFCHLISCMVSAVIDSPSTLAYSGLPMFPLTSVGMRVR